MIDTAFAMAPTSASGSGDPHGLLQFLPLIMIFGIFYFILIRPQQKQAKEHRKMLSELKKGDAVITSGGIYGKIVSIADQVLTVEIADKVRVRVSRAHIAGLVSTPAALEPPREG